MASFNAGSCDYKFCFLPSLCVLYLQDEDLDTFYVVELMLFSLFFTITIKM